MQEYVAVVAHRVIDNRLLYPTKTNILSLKREKQFMTPNDRTILSFKRVGDDYALITVSTIPSLER